MVSAILQVRDVPEPVLATLRDRAAQRGVSLSAYVRDLLARDAAQPTMSEAIAQVSDRTPVEADDSEIVTAVREGRR